MLGKRVHQCDKEKVVERHLEQEPDPNRRRTETVDASSRSHSASEEGCMSVMGTFASLCMPITLAPYSDLCRLLSMADGTPLPAM